MDPGTMMAIAQGASSVLGFLGGEDTNQANSAQSQAQMDFQREMSNTSYQRAVVDMKAAGLNPMLAYSQGGASSPGGSQAVMQNTTAAAAAAAQATAGMQLTNAQTDKTRAEADYTRAQTLLPPEQIAEIRQRVGTGSQSARQLSSLADYYEARNREGYGVSEGRRAFHSANREQYQAEGEEAYKYRSPSGFQTPQIESMEQSAGASKASAGASNASARRQIAGAILDELRQPEHRAQAGYWNDVRKGGVYFDKGSQALGRLTSSAASAARAGRGFRP